MTHLPTIMEQSLSNKIRYTVRYYKPVAASGTAKRPVRTISQDEPPTEIRLDSQENETKPIIEIVCAADVTSNGLDGKISDQDGVLHETNTRDEHMIVHSPILSQIIRDVVKSYPE